MAKVAKPKAPVKRGGKAGSAVFTALKPTPVQKVKGVKQKVTGSGSGTYQLQTVGTTPAKVKTAVTKATKPKAPKPTNWLAPMTQQQVTKQATDIVNKEYQPQYTDLNNQANQAKALDSKRAADQKQYDAWLAGQGAALQTANQNMLNSLQSTNAALSSAANTQLDQSTGTVNGALQAEAQPTTGSNANAMLTAAMSAAGKQQMSTAAQAANTKSAIGASGVANSVANAYSNQSAIRGQQIQDLNTTLTNLQNQRNTVHQNQIADLAKEISTLQTNEVNKAQAQQNYQAAQQQLAIQEANTSSEISSRNTTAKASATNAKTAQVKADNQAKQYAYTDEIAKAKVALEKLQNQTTNKKNAAANKLQQEKLKELIRHDQAGEATARARVNKSGSSSSSGGSSTAKGPANALSQSETNSMYQRLDEVKGQIQNLVNHGVTANQAYHLILNGGQYNAGTSAKPKTATAKQASPQILDAAYNLYTTGSLNTNNVKALNKLGIYGVRARYKVHSPKAKKGGNPGGKNPLRGGKSTLTIG